MPVNRNAVIAAAVLCLEAAVPAGAQNKPILGSDWTRVKFDLDYPARLAEKCYPTFKFVVQRSVLDITCPFPADPKDRGRGRVVTNSYFWSPTKFQIEYVVYSTKRKGLEGSPVSEWLISDSGKITRRGEEVGSNLKYNPKMPVFNIASDAQLVEVWPAKFPKFLYSSFAHGNATLGRYLKALARGVGGYSIETDERVVRMSLQEIPQYRIVATRPARGNRPASRIEMIFSEMPGLPVEINSTYGSKYDLRWTSAWLNDRPGSFPPSPSYIGLTEHQKSGNANQKGGKPTKKGGKKAAAK